MQALKLVEVICRKCNRALTPGQYLRIRAKLNGAQDQFECRRCPPLPTPTFQEYWDERHRQQLVSDRANAHQKLDALFDVVVERDSGLAGLLEAAMVNALLEGLRLRLMLCRCGKPISTHAISPHHETD